MKIVFAELRAQVDRIMSRQLLDQEQFEKKLNTLLQQQATLEQRTTALTGDLSITGAIKPARTAPPATMPAEKPARASPINDTVIFVARTAGEHDACRRAGHVWRPW
jgi:hypothetical protein